VQFRPLSLAEIERYVDAEKPFDCAGSFKCEGLGITLFDAIKSTDPTALVGLPLILTARLLREAGFVLP
jgi:septum formation protein